jgi:tetratricopeptide (TPR) repeat protein
MKINVSIRSPVFPVILVLIVSCIVYLNTVTNGFVYDDIYQVVKNPWITNVKYVPDIFLKKTWGFTGVGSSNYYRPMMLLLYMFDYYVFGLKSWGFHLTNICFHSGTAVLVFLIAWRLFEELERGRSNLPVIPGSAAETRLRVFALFTSNDSRSFAFLAALLFEVHPIHTEAVAWIAGLPDLSFTLFYLLSFYFFIRSNPKTKASYSPSATFFFLSLLCKETALTLPIILFAYDYVLRSTVKRPINVRKYFPYLAAAGIYLILRIYALGGVVPENIHRTMSIYQYAINVFPLLVQYLMKLLFPINLSALYVFRPISGLFSVKGILSFILFVAFCFLVIKTRRRNGVAFMSLLFIAVPLIPTFYIAAIAQPFAERYLYLPSFGFALVLSFGLIRARAATTGGALSMITAALILLLMGGYAAATIQRNTIWRDSYSLWADTVRKSPDSFIAHLGLGNALLEDKNRADDAIAQYRSALELNPRSPDVHDNLGFAFFKKGRTYKAMEQYRLALSLAPRHADTRANLGLALARLGRTEEAMEQYRLAIESDPTFADPHDYLGVAYLQIGEAEWALREFEIAVRLDPSNEVFHKDFSRARKMTGDAKGK